MKRKNIIFGLILIIIGVITILNVTNVIDINLFFKGWWTLFIIVPCLIGLFTDDDKTGSIIGILFGVALLLSARSVITYDLVWKLIIPAILVVIGISIILKNTFTEKTETNKKNNLSIFSKKEITLDETFIDVDISAIFGGSTCNIKSEKIKEKATINAYAIFGGIDLYVPDDVKVIVKPTSFFGGVEQKQIKENNDAKKVLYINAICVFGGIEIK